MKIIQHCAILLFASCILLASVTNANAHGELTANQQDVEPAGILHDPYSPSEDGVSWSMPPFNMPWPMPNIPPITIPPFTIPNPPPFDIPWPFPNLPPFNPSPIDPSPAPSTGSTPPPTDPTPPPSDPTPPTDPTPVQPPPTIPGSKVPTIPRDPPTRPPAPPKLISLINRGGDL